MTVNRRPILAIDTATAITGVALFDGKILGEVTWHSGQNQTTQLLQAIKWLLDHLGLDIDALAAVAVCLGPGSFNGLRVGVAAAKGLSIARDIPCLGVGIMEATAFQYVGVDIDIRPIYDAGRGEVTTALYSNVGQQLRLMEAARLTSLSALAAEITEPALLCGDVAPSSRAFLRERIGQMVSFPPESGMGRRPGYLAELAWRRWQSGEQDDVTSLEPIYLRKPAITAPKG